MHIRHSQGFPPRGLHAFSAKAVSGRRQAYFFSSFLSLDAAGFFGAPEPGDVLLAGAALGVGAGRAEGNEPAPCGALAEPTPELRVNGEGAEAAPCGEEGNVGRGAMPWAPPTAPVLPVLRTKGEGLETGGNDRKLLPAPGLGLELGLGVALGAEGKTGPVENRSPFPDPLPPVLGRGEEPPGLVTEGGYFNGEVAPRGYPFSPAPFVPEEGFPVRETPEEKGFPEVRGRAASAGDREERSAEESRSGKGEVRSWGGGDPF